MNRKKWSDEGSQPSRGRFPGHFGESRRRLGSRSCVRIFRAWSNDQSAPCDGCPGGLTCEELLFAVGGMWVEGRFGQRPTAACLGQTRLLRRASGGPDGITQQNSTMTREKGRAASSGALSGIARRHVSSLPCWSRVIAGSNPRSAPHQDPPPAAVIVGHQPAEASPMQSANSRGVSTCSSLDATSSRCRSPDTTASTPCACASCRVEYRRLRREMRGRDWQGSAAAVFLPMPARLMNNLAMGRERHPEHAPLDPAPHAPTAQCSPPRRARRATPHRSPRQCAAWRRAIL